MPGADEAAMLRSVLLSRRGGVELRRLRAEFRELTGRELPGGGGGGGDGLESYLVSQPGVVRLERRSDGTVVCHAVETKEVARVSRMISVTRGKTSSRSRKSLHASAPAKSPLGCSTRRGGSAAPASWRPRVTSSHSRPRPTSSSSSSSSARGRVPTVVFKTTALTAAPAPPPPPGHVDLGGDRGSAANPPSLSRRLGDRHADSEDFESRHRALSSPGVEVPTLNWGPVRSTEPVMQVTSASSVPSTVAGPRAHSPPSVETITLALRRWTLTGGGGGGGGDRWLTQSGRPQGEVSTLGAPEVRPPMRAKLFRSPSPSLRSAMVDCPPSTKMSARDQPHRPIREPATVDRPIREPATVGRPLREPATVDRPLREPALMNRPIREPATMNRPIREPAAVVRPLMEPALMDRPLREPATVDRPIREPALMDRPLREPATMNRPIREPAAVNRPLREPALMNRPLREPAAVDRPIREPALMDRPLREPATMNCPIREPAMMDRPLREPATVDRPLGEPATVDLWSAARSWDGRLTPASPLVSPWPPAGSPVERCVDVLVSSARHPALFAVQAWSQLHRLERLEARMWRHYGNLRGHGQADVAEEAEDEEVAAEEVATEPSFVACVQDDRVYRVELKCACPPGKAMVYRVDYGEWDLVPLSTLRPLVPAFTRLPVQAHLAQLADVPCRRWSPELSQVFRKLVEGRPFVARVEGAGGDPAGRAPRLRVSLVDTSHPERDVVIGQVMMGFARDW